MSGYIYKGGEPLPLLEAVRAFLEEWASYEGANARANTAYEADKERHGWEYARNKGRLGLRSTYKHGCSCGECMTMDAERDRLSA